MAEPGNEQWAKELVDKMVAKGAKRHFAGYYMSTFNFNSEAHIAGKHVTVTLKFNPHHLNTNVKPERVLRAFRDYQIEAIPSRLRPISDLKKKFTFISVNQGDTYDSPYWTWQNPIGAIKQRYTISF